MVKHNHHHLTGDPSAMYTSSVICTNDGGNDGSGWNVNTVSNWDIMDAIQHVLRELETLHYRLDTGCTREQARKALGFIGRLEDNGEGR